MDMGAMLKRPVFTRLRGCEPNVCAINDISAQRLLLVGYGPDGPQFRFTKQGAKKMTVNQQTLEGNWKTIKGKLREKWGRLSGDDLDSIHGNVEQLVGTIQQKTGEARDTVEKYLEELTSGNGSVGEKASDMVRQYAQTAQDTVQDVAKQASEVARQASDVARQQYKKTEEMVQQRPVESLAFCFGAGMLSGVLLALMMRSK